MISGAAKKMFGTVTRCSADKPGGLLVGTVIAPTRHRLDGSLRASPPLTRNNLCDAFVDVLRGPRIGLRSRVLRSVGIPRFLH